MHAVKSRSLKFTCFLLLLLALETSLELPIKLCFTNSKDSKDMYPRKVDSNNPSFIQFRIVALDTDKDVAASDILILFTVTSSSVNKNIVQIS